MKTFEIRPYEKGDFAAVAAIHDAARLQELYRAGRPEAYQPFERVAPTEKIFETYQVYVADVDDNVRGYVAFKEDELALLYVNPLFARQGIGIALARYAMVCSEGKKMELTVLDGNEPALALFKKAGFEEIGTEMAPLLGAARMTARVHRMAHEGDVQLF